MAKDFIKVRKNIRADMHTTAGKINFIDLFTPALVRKQKSKAGIWLFRIPASKWETKDFHELVRVTERGDTAHCTVKMIQKLLELFNDEPTAYIDTADMLACNGRLMGHKAEAWDLRTYGGRHANKQEDRDGVDLYIDGRYQVVQCKYIGFSAEVLTGVNKRSGSSGCNWTW